MYRLILLILLNASVATAGEQHYLCNKDEQVLFGCTVGKKMVSVCTSQKFTKSSGYVQYRFGVKNKIELQYPASLVPPQKNFFFSNTPYSGGGAARIRFSINDDEYIVFDSTIRTNVKPGEPNYPEFTAGLITQHMGKITSLRKCSDDASIRAEAYTNLEPEDWNNDIDP